MKIMLSVSPSLVFFHTNFTISDLKSKYILTVIELGLPLSESSTRISDFYYPTDSEHKFHKTRIIYWLSIGFELEFPWKRTYNHNYNTMFNIQFDRESQTFIYPPSSKFLNNSAGDLSLTLNCASCA